MFFEKDSSIACTSIPGHALLHRGHHRHRAEPITSGERCNFIVWCRKRPKHRVYGK